MYPLGYSIDILVTIDKKSQRVLFSFGKAWTYIKVNVYPPGYNICILVTIARIIEKE